MDYRGIEIVCPLCKSDLREAQGDGNWLSCVACEGRFPIVLDIPDLRVQPDHYIDMQGDRAKGAELASRAAGLNFASAVDLYYSLADKVTPNQAIQFKRGLMAAKFRAEESLEKWEAQSSQTGKPGSFLEIGCGTAALLLTAAGRYERVVGVDIAFRWLIIAKKRLEEAGADIPLISACAEALPFPDRAFDRVTCSFPPPTGSVWDRTRMWGFGLEESCRSAGWLHISAGKAASLQGGSCSL
jgi:uncharacterized protein YbaR (Trm112 family)